jgi:hypothetical protein
MEWRKTLVNTRRSRQNELHVQLFQILELDGVKWGIVAMCLDREGVCEADASNGPAKRDLEEPTWKAQ